MNPILIIPARMASTRLPGKVLADIAGQPMILRVWKQAMAAGLGPVVVAAAEPQIAAATTTGPRSAATARSQTRTIIGRPAMSARGLPGRRAEAIRAGINRIGFMAGFPEGSV